MRRERRCESLRGHVPLEYGAPSAGEILPVSMSRPAFRQLCHGEFDDCLANCLFQMHDLTDLEHLRQIILGLKPDHKEIIFFLGIRLYPAKLLADLRGQTERNIRKVRDVVCRRIRRQLYAALFRMNQERVTLTHQEQHFLKNYVAPAKQRRKASANDAA